MIKKRRNRGVPKFLSKLVEILDGRMNEECLGWEEDGQAFVVKDQFGLAEKVLPLYFSHSNYHSFIRQLYIYGFTKSRSIEGYDVFRHPIIIRGNSNNLHLVKRSQKIKEESLESTMDKSSLLSRLKQQIGSLQLKQLALLHGMQMLEMTQRSADLKFQMLETELYHQDLECDMGYFVLFILERYLNRSLNGGDVLETEMISRLNENIQHWVVFNSSVVEPKMASATKFFFTFNLKCRVFTRGGQEYVMTISKDFINWLMEFVAKNCINFPNVELFFTKLIFCSFRDSGLSLDSEKKDNKFLSQISILLEKLFGGATHYSNSEDYCRSPTELRYIF